MITTLWQSWTNPSRSLTILYFANRQVAQNTQNTVTWIKTNFDNRDFQTQILWAIKGYDWKFKLKNIIIHELKSHAYIRKCGDSISINVIRI